MSGRRRRSRHRKQLMLVTGASGLLGRHLTGTEATRTWDLYAPSSRILEVTDRQLVDDEIDGWEPTAVVHLAYRKDDHRTIVAGSANVARAAARVGARLVHVSTDLVFSGRAEPYREDDPLEPFGDYGRWKAEAEQAVVAEHADAAIVRTSLLYGTSILAVIQEDVQRAMTGRSAMRFFTDEVRCPAHASDVAGAIAAIAARGEIRGPIHVAGPEALSRSDLARLFASWLGYDPGRVPTSTIAESGLERAGRVVLDTGRADALGLSCRPVTDALAGAVS